MLKTSRAVQNILDLEDAAPDALFEHLPDSPVPLWPLVRMSFAGALAATEHGEVTITQKADPWRVRRRLVKALLPSRWDARGFRGHRDLCFVVGGATTYASPQGERNWLIDDYVAQFPADAVTLQWRPLPSVHGAPAFRDTRSLDPMDARTGFRVRRTPLSARTTAAIDALTREFARLAKVTIAPEQLAEIRRLARRFEQFRPAVAAEFDHILDRVRPRVVLMEDASYGHHGALIAQIKDRGIRVAEPQHGWIGPSHGAYNFGAAMRTPELSRTLPDDLLTFGTFWSDGVRHPAEKVAIGKPHLERMARDAAPVTERPAEIVVVSSVAHPEVTERFTLELSAALPEGWRVRFRPHPSERDTVSARYPRLVAAGIELDPHADVFVSLATARAVVGVASTVLFEAIAMECAVFVRDTPFAENIVGDLFGPRTSDDLLVTRIADAVSAAVPETPGPVAGIRDQVWRPDPVDAFRSWAAERLLTS